MSTKKILISHKGRKCNFRGCKSSLSIYNHEKQCHVHLGLAKNDEAKPMPYMKDASHF